MAKIFPGRGRRAQHGGANVLRIMSRLVLTHIMV
jgi:hypothetical protein